MNKIPPLIGAALGATVVVLLLLSGDAEDAPPSNPDIEHGRYIVHNVCLCIVCHSPRDANGKLVDSQLLRGGAIPVASPYQDSDWALEAPKIAGLRAGWTAEDLAHFLQTGKTPLGR